MDKAANAKIAKERIIYLFKLAQEAVKKGEIETSKKYVGLALRIGMKMQISVPRELKRKFCKECNVYWIPSKTLRVRTKKKEKRIIFTCLNCGAVRRFPYVKENL